MKSLKKQRRIQVIILTFVALIISTALIGYAMRDGINFFRSPSQIIAEPPAATEVFRIGGLVEEGTLVRGEGETVRFSVTDGGASVPVSFTGVLPDLFKENEGMVGTGKYIDGVFVASESTFWASAVKRNYLKTLPREDLGRPRNGVSAESG